MTETPPDEAARWLDDSGNVRKIYRGLWLVCVLLLFGGEGLLVWARNQAGDHAGHVGFGFEQWPGFYGLFGFVACVALVLAAKDLRKLLMRPENYYESFDRLSSAVHPAKDDKSSDEITTGEATAERIEPGAADGD